MLRLLKKSRWLKERVMSADFKKLEERVAFLEREVRRTSALIDFVEARADKSLVGMNQHLDTQDTQLQEFIQETRARFETLEQAVQETKTRLDSLEQSGQEMKARLDNLETSIQEANARLGGLEQLVQETKQAVQGNATRLDSLEQAVQENTTRLGSLEKSVQENTTRLDNLEKLVQENKQSLQETNTFVVNLAESTTKGFDYVHGKLADLDSNMTEVRNLLAFLVEKQK
jgi:structural maintenance of chromosome 3 (chondroitin sulfate proteoglycan 6)